MRPLPLVIALVLSVWGHPGIASEKRPPNILFLISDDQRPDTISAFGNEKIKTPHLDRLAKSGVSFTRAVCANPICVASRAEILTGVSGFRNGILAIKGDRLVEGLPSWPETFRKGGYETWYVGKWHTAGRPSTWGYVDTLGLFGSGGGKWAEGQRDWKGDEVTGYRGWVFQTDDRKFFPERGVGLTPDIDAKFADAAVAFLRRRPEKPFFLHVNFTAPHDPLFLPPGFEDAYDAEEMAVPPNFLPEHPFEHGNLRGRDEVLLPFPRTPEIVRRLLATYYSVIGHLDQQVGRILDVLEETGQLENTIVVYTSDHGLAVGSHGLRGKQNMYEHTVNVPLIISGPGVPKNEMRDAQVYLRELFPTSCELAGIPIPEAVEGRSFADVIRGEGEGGHDAVFCYFRDSQRMVRGKGWKLIHYPTIDRYQLFHLEEDPFETRDLSGEREHAAEFRRLKERLEAWRAEVKDPYFERSR